MTRPAPRPDAEWTLRPKLPLPAMTLGGILIALVAVGAVTFFTLDSMRVRGEAAELVQHTHEVLLQVRGVVSGLTEAETGERGYLLTGDERYLASYNAAISGIPGLLGRLQDMIADNPRQVQRASALERMTSDILSRYTDTIAQRRAGNVEAAVAMVRTGWAVEAMQRARAITTEMENEELALLATRQQAWEDARDVSTYVTVGGAVLLVVLITAAAGVMGRDFRARENQVWLRTGQMGLSTRLQGEQRLESLGEHVLAFLAGYIDAQVGAVYVAEGAGRYRRIATYAFPSESDGGDVFRHGEGLVGQAVKENRPLHVTDVPRDYLKVSSSLGAAAPMQLVVLPASVDGVVQAVVELGFFRHIQPLELELLGRISETLGVAVRSSKDRSRLEELLEETQRQAEELQTQQEELRVSNEELEEQSRVLRESQARLENQQSELEQINSQLEEQTQLLEHQKDELATAQVGLTEKAGELERANQYKSEFLANMSHELRTPLNSQLILAKLLADNKAGNLTEEQVRFAQTIFSAGNDLLALINDILDLSKIEAGKIELTIEPVPIAKSVESVARGLQPLAAQKGLGFTVAVDADVPERFQCDAQRLGQILTNLISNAIKFTEHGEVSLRVSAAAGDRIAFAVRDTGIGIAPHQQAIIFEAFRQADGSTHRRYGGTGLGLSISRDLAQKLGGDIRVDSTPGQGSVFTLTLPVACEGAAAAKAARAADLAARPTVAPPSAPPRPAPPSPTSPPVDDDRDRRMPGSRCVLVVEDDQRFAAVLRDLAHEMGFQCVITHTAGEGLQAATQYAPSAILLDVNLPDYSGLGVLDQLKRNPQTRHIPVHVVSVADHAHQALERGAVGYALKPVKREQLVEVFERFEARLTQGVRRLLVVEDDRRQRESIEQLLASDGVQITGVETAAEALARLKAATFDCMVMDLNLPDLSGYELLEQMAEQDDVSFPPVIVYTGRSLTRDEEQRLSRFSKSIIIKDARSPERLLDEVTLFLHQVESTLPAERQRMLKAARAREAALEERRILVVEDDARNIFALANVLEPKGAKVVVARNGREALEALAVSRAPGGQAIDLVLMDIMMPEMDGLTAMREIRRQAIWKDLPIIALTAKAMKDDQEKCLAAGASDYIAKPLDVEKLLSLVRVWMPK
jgi:CheY-like chemotaxis protein/CHASE3 domain sensor protein